MSSGRIKYVPKSLLDEIDNIKSAEEVVKDSRAMDSLAEYSRLGRLAKRRGLL